MNIYLRISENQESISGSDRWNSYDKKFILKKCWKSLMMNLNNEDSLKIFHHEVSDNTLEWLGNNCNNLIDFYKVDSIQESFTATLASMKYDLSLDEDPDKLYALLEDDYLWNANALNIIKESSQYWKGFMIPNDFPQNYHKLLFSKVFVGLDRHWRSTNHISWSLIGCNKIFKEWIDFIITAGLDIKKLNKMLDETDCVNPLPGVATHCKEKEMTPLVNWKFIWDGIDI
jgi:hypothetical protein